MLALRAYAPVASAKGVAARAGTPSSYPCANAKQDWGVAYYVGKDTGNEIGTIDHQKDRSWCLA